MTDEKRHGIALDGHVVRRRDEDRPVEVRLVRELVQHLRELALRRREAHVHDVEALFDRPAEPAEQDRARAGVAGAEHPRAVDLALGRQPADHAGARRAVPAEVTFLVRRRHGLAVLADGDHDSALDLADLGMARVDAAVEDADAHAFAGRALERPLARDAVGPIEVELVRRARRQRPCGKRALLCYRASASLSRCAIT